MAFDGIAVAALTKELNTKLAGGIISRIVQPEKEELLLTIKQYKETYRLFISANASLPLIYLTEENKSAPMEAPAFCMLLRKYLQNGRIISVTQPGLERVIRFQVSHRDELGDLSDIFLIVEIMGKHSNIILVDAENTILDAIKRIPASVSSVREVLTGRPYFIPETAGKKDPFSLLTDDSFTESVISENAIITAVPVNQRTEFESFDKSDSAAYSLPAERISRFVSELKQRPENISKALASAWQGISFIAAEEFCYEADIDDALPVSAVSEDSLEMLANCFIGHLQAMRSGEFTPEIVFNDGEPIEFSAIPLLLYGTKERRPYDSISEVLRTYYAEKNRYSVVRQKSANLRHITTTALNRATRKLELQRKQMADTEKADQYRLYGELLQAYGYGCDPDEKSITVNNYYTNEPVTIPLKTELSPQENAQRYFERYNKLKRTKASLTDQISETERDIAQLDAVLTSLDLAENDTDLTEIRRELADAGFAKAELLHSGTNGRSGRHLGGFSNRSGGGSGRSGGSYSRSGKGSGGRGNHTGDGGSKKERYMPLSYRSSDGYLIYVGKNNLQNEYITFTLASPDDFWFHAKGVPGSHVIVKCEGKSEKELPDRLFEEAGALAAAFSKNRMSPKVEIDYTLRRNLRKTPGGAPGFVIYHTNYSLMAKPDISGLTKLS